MSARKLLFICSRNKIRSLTAEELFRGVPGYDVRSAGTQPDSRVKVTPGLLRWADQIFVMEKSHLNKLKIRFPEEIGGKEVLVLHIPDEYEFMQRDLIDELLGKLSPHLDTDSFL